MTRKDIKEHTISKFKGINASRKGTAFEARGLADDQLVDVINWNIAPEGFLEKRPGIAPIISVIVPTTPLRLRLLILLRPGVDSSLSPFALCTDGSRLWRVYTSPGSGYFEHLLPSAQPLGNLQWAVEYGGTSPSTAYRAYCIRSDAAHSITAAQGSIATVAVGGTVTSDWAPNTPPGTHMTLHKSRAWVINSYGGDSFATPQTAGDETKVWFSDPGNPSAYGGVGVPSNFNLDHGDGDYLVASIPYNDQLLFFKTRKTYVVSVSGQPSDWTTRTISDTIGCVGRGTVKLIDGKIYFLSTQGIVRTDGASAELISDNVVDLLQQYRDFKVPQNTLDIYASYWQGKYILWLPRLAEVTIGDTAIVFDLATQTWTTWNLVGGTSYFGEARLPEKTGDSIYLGSWSGNRLWRLNRDQWTDNGTAYACSFTTKKLDMGTPMSRKRNYVMGMTVKDDSNDPGTYTVTQTADDNTAKNVVSTAVPAKQSVANIKLPGGGYGSYFQTRVSHTGTGYAAVYDVTWINEERSLGQKSLVGGSAPGGITWIIGPNPQDKLNAGFVLK